MNHTLIDILYLTGTVLFVIGLKRLSHPNSSRHGNMLSAVGMGLGIVASMISPLAEASNNYGWVFGALMIGSVIGLVSAKKVQMTDMPQLVSIFNGLGGACAVALAMVELRDNGSAMTSGEPTVTILALIIGGIAFTGSLLAYGKLQGIVNDSRVTFPGHNILNLIILAGIIGFTSYILMVEGQLTNANALILMGLTLVYGFSFVAPIGGADMPVVISLLNSFTGLSAAAAGFIYSNNLMIVGGILVGASGTILTIMMCQAMNRSLINVLIGGFGASTSAGGKAQGDLVVKESSTNDTAIQLFYSKSVVFVPGYGLAVAQAQKICKELDDLLEANGVEVRYAIHPVAGRMPGHMNVLLAEADVPYPKLLDLEEANDFIAKADVVVVVGANDVVNPSAEDDPSSSIYGMPVLKVWEAENVVVLKRSMRSGYAGIQNPLFFHDKTKMLFGDAKESIQKLVDEVKSM